MEEVKLEKLEKVCKGVERKQHKTKRHEARKGKHQGLDRRIKDVIAVGGTKPGKVLSFCESEKR